jgi:hypothetical protein
MTPNPLPSHLHNPLYVTDELGFFLHRLPQFERQWERRQGVNVGSYQRVQRAWRAGEHEPGFQISALFGWNCFFVQGLLGIQEPTSTILDVFLDQPSERSDPLAPFPLLQIVFFRLPALRSSQVSQPEGEVVVDRPG